MPEDKAESRIKIYPETPHLILCEGRDAYNFLIWLLVFLKNNDPVFNVFRVYDFGGITELKQYLSTLTKQDEFKRIVRSLCIIRDAETDARSACQSIKGSLKNGGFAVPPKPCFRTANGSAKYPNIATGFILFPSCDATPQNGTLEDLCLQILAKEDAAKVLSDADAALKPYTERLPRLPKNRLHTYFSLTDDFVSWKLGEAARDKAFSFEAPQIDSLKSFLLQMTGA